MSANVHTAILIAIMSLVTIAIRFLPFLIWSGERKTPAYIAFLGKVLPYAVMGMLVVYCLKGVSLAIAPHGVPEAIAVVLVAVTYLWKRNTLISVGLGTLCYMLLVQLVF